MDHRLIRSLSYPSSAENSPATSVSTSDDTHLRVFLVQTAKGLFSSSGGYKANFCLLRYLASRGHTVRQLCYSNRGEVDTYVQDLARTGKHDPQLRSRQLHIRAEYGEMGTDVRIDELLMENGIEILTLDKEAFDVAFGGKENILKAIPREAAAYIEEGRLSERLNDYVVFLQHEIRTFSPTHIMFNDGLSMQATSRLEMPELSACRVAVIHTAEQLPFGPFAGGMAGHMSSPTEMTLLQELDGIWSVSEAIKRYASEHGQLATRFFTHHPWTYFDEKTLGLPCRLRNWDKRFVGMINPCKVKGFQILHDLASACPQHDFLDYKSWGFDTTTGAQLERLQNVILRPSCKDMEEAWHDIKVLLVPSLWYEAWGIVVIEAHLRGIPVISSDAGALTEAMLGSENVIPVNSIRGARDKNGEYIVPRQDIQPWIKALNRLMEDESEYEKLSEEVHTTTRQWLQKIDRTGLENWLVDMSSRASKMVDIC